MTVCCDASSELPSQVELVRFQAGVIARELNKLALGTVQLDRPLILKHQQALRNFGQELKILQRYFLEVQHD